MVDEMIKLRKILDDRNIEWKDESSHYKLSMGGEIIIDRTHFTVKGHRFSAINGFGTYGGYTARKEDNLGKIELMELDGALFNDGEPVGHLFADDVIKQLEEIFGEI